MANKTKTTTAPTKKATKAPTAGSARHPLARVNAQHGGREKLIDALVAPLTVGDESTDVLRGRLLKTPNHKLLHLASVVATVKSKYGSRDKLVAAVGKAGNKSKDKDYVAHLETLPLPRLLDLARSAR
jgi:hypothetical protein